MTTKELRERFEVQSQSEEDGCVAAAEYWGLCRDAMTELEARDKEIEQYEWLLAQAKNQIDDSIKLRRHAAALAGALEGGINPDTGMTREWYAMCVEVLEAYRKEDWEEK